jgi:putative membrane-bound dehydrogenase-like protein
MYPRRIVGLVTLGGLLLSAAAARGQGFSPEEALKRMKVADGFEVKLVAAEPMIRQPVSMSFDDRGRLWVLQYLQYPTPAGLKAVKVDQYLRTTYDRVPEPPPRGPKGADRITILSDPDETGRFRKSKDFITGLNLASGFCLGHGGVYVAQPPYLLFYPDRNGDDVPDGDPEVLLTGFGMEDAHAFANSLQWGPDGWLYGAHGSTSYANIRGYHFAQGIWRYHPLTKDFELFAEGGGNTWGLDFDRHGNVIAGTNWGGKAMLHQVQGGYYIKGFAKHGPLSNPYAFGYFDHVPYTGFRGGHVTCGGIVYEGGAFPEKYRHLYVAGNLLSNVVHWHTLEPSRSSFVSRFAGELLAANDTWFRPVDLETGPDGSLYIADWYDKRATHLDARDTWDRTNGRIYKVEAKGQKTFTLLPRPLARYSSNELVDLLGHPNNWYSREARRLLAERRDRAVLSRLRELIEKDKGQLALEALWALYVSGGFNDAQAARLLHHANEDVRTWTVRLLGDAKEVTPALAKQLADLARSDPSPMVRSQLASSARRLPGRQGLPIVRELLRRSEDVDDPLIPLLLWWAIEARALSDRDAVLAMLDDAPTWRLPLVRRYLIERLGRRYMAEGKDAGYRACARLLDRAPGPDELRLLIVGMDRALEGRRLATVPAALEKPLTALWESQGKDPMVRGKDPTVLRFALHLGSAYAYRQALSRADDPRLADAERADLILTLGQTGRQEVMPVLVAVLKTAKTDSLRRAALTALEAFPNAEVGRAILALYPRLSTELRGRAQTLLLSRPASALALLREVDAKHIAARDIPVDRLRPLAQQKNTEITRLIEKHWGRIGAATAGEKQNRIGYFRYALGKGRGNPVKGQALFTQHCAICHTLFGQGNKIGPDLTGADRKSLDFLLPNIVDPSAVQRLEYANQVVVTTDGRNLTGVVAEAGPESVTLVDAKNVRTTVPRAQIEQMLASPVSLMPEGILDPLSDQELRDLFSYLQGDAPKASGGRQPPDPGQQGANAPRSPVLRSPATGSPGKVLSVCLVSGSLEYHSDESLSAFQDYLEKHYPVRCTRAFRKTDDDLPGLENLDTCDVMLLFTRRLTISGAQLERVKKYCRSGKPIVAVRTASHAFQNWLALDREVLGGNYHNHYGAGPSCRIEIVRKAAGHPVLKGFRPYASVASLYKNTGLARDDEVLLTGSIPGHTEPIAWTRSYKGGRIFYTSLGHPRDFANESFRRLLVNALYWTTGRTPPEEKK